MENMTTEQTDELAPADAADKRVVVYADKRIMVSWDEAYAANRALLAILRSYGVRPAETSPGNFPVDLTNDSNAQHRLDLLRDVLRAINFERLGYAQGSIARHKDGRVAKRYYDHDFDCLRWLVLQNENGPINAQRIDDDEFDSGWTIVHNEPWDVGGGSGTRFRDLPI